MTTKLTDIARMAHVSVSTVSRVINHTKYVNPELQKTIEELVARTGYTPNHIAKSLATKKTQLLGVIIPDVAHRFYSVLLSGIEEVANRRGYRIIICDIAQSIDKELNYLHVLKAMNADGIILMHEKFTPQVEEFLRSSETPYVLSSVKSKNLAACSVNIDDFAAAYEAAAYLAGLGHRRIAMIGGDIGDITTGQNRYHGFRKALADNGLAFSPELFASGNFEVPDGYRAMGGILDRGRPTAVFTVSDEMAFGAINCILDRGLRVPQDISVVGFDDVDLASYARPQLTTIHQPIREIGMKSAETLLGLMDGRVPENPDILLPYTLIKRESCRPVGA